MLDSMLTQISGCPKKPTCDPGCPEKRRARTSAGSIVGPALCSGWGSDRVQPQKMGD